jgi:hypothetical protein
MANGSAPLWEKGQPFGPAGSTAILESADYALDRFRALGRSMPENNRLARARAHVQLAHDRAATPPEGQLLAEATRTIFELYLISRAFGTSTDPRFLNSLEIALGGPDLPGDEDDASSMPRNIQFELYIGAWFVAGGKRIALAEPDLQLEYDGRPIGIAAKRVRSRSKIMRRVSRASRQILAHGSEGIIALNVDHLLDELPSAKGEAERGRHFDASFPEFARVMTSLATRPHVRGLLVVGHQARWVTDADPPTVDVGAFTKFHLITNESAEQAIGDQFLASLKQEQTVRLGHL